MGKLKNYKDYRRLKYACAAAPKPDKVGKQSRSAHHRNIEAAVQNELEAFANSKRLNRKVLKELDRYPSLAKAAFLGSERIVESLLDLDCDVNIQVADGSTPLILALENGHSGIVQKLLKKGADPRLAREDGRNALMVAVAKNDERSFTLIWSYWDKNNQSDINYKDKRGYSALAIAAEAGNTKFVKLFAGMAGADVDQQTEEGRSPLMFAVSSGRADNVKILLESGADVLVEDKRGSTAVCLAMAQNKTEILALLLGALDEKMRDAYVKTRIELITPPFGEPSVLVLFCKDVLFRVLLEVKRSIPEGGLLLEKHKVLVYVLGCLRSYQQDSDLLQAGFHLSACLIYDKAEYSTYIAHGLAEQYVHAKGLDFSLKVMTASRQKGLSDLRQASFLPVQACARLPACAAWLALKKRLIAPCLEEFREAFPTMAFWVAGERVKAKIMLERFEEVFADLENHQLPQVAEDNSKDALALEPRKQDPDATSQQQSWSVVTRPRASSAKPKLGKLLNFSVSKKETKKAQALKLQKRKFSWKKAPTGSVIACSLDVPGDATEGEIDSAAPKAVNYAAALKRNLDDEDGKESLKGVKNQNASSDIAMTSTYSIPPKQTNETIPLGEMKLSESKPEDFLRLWEKVSQSEESVTMMKMLIEMINKPKKGSPEKAVDCHTSDGDVKSTRSSCDAESWDLEFMGDPLERLTTNTSGSGLFDGTSGKSSTGTTKGRSFSLEPTEPPTPEASTSKRRKAHHEDRETPAVEEICRKPSYAQAVREVVPKVQSQSGSGAELEHHPGEASAALSNGNQVSGPIDLASERELEQKRELHLTAQIQEVVKANKNQAAQEVRTDTKCLEEVTDVQSLSDCSADASFISDESVTFGTVTLADFVPKSLKSKTLEISAPSINAADDSRNLFPVAHDFEDTMNTELEPIELDYVPSKRRFWGLKRGFNEIFEKSGFVLCRQFIQSNVFDLKITYHYEENSGVMKSGKSVPTDMSGRIHVLSVLEGSFRKLQKTGCQEMNFAINGDLARFERPSLSPPLSRKPPPKTSKTVCYSVVECPPVVKTDTLLRYLKLWFQQVFVGLEDRLRLHRLDHFGVFNAGVGRIRAFSVGDFRPSTSEPVSDAVTVLKERNALLELRMKFARVVHRAALTSKVRRSRSRSRTSSLKQRKGLDVARKGSAKRNIPDEHTANSSSGFKSPVVYCQRRSRWYEALKGIESCTPMSYYSSCFSETWRADSEPVTPLHELVSSRGKIVFSSKAEHVLRSGKHETCLGLMHEGYPVVVRQLPKISDDTYSLIMKKSRLRHSNLVTFYCLSENPATQRFCCVTELMEFSLPEYLKLEARAPGRLLVQGLVDALRYLHFNHIVHGFLKPSNILVSIDDRIKIADYFLLKARPLVCGIQGDRRNFASAVGSPLSDFCWRPTELFVDASSSEATQFISTASDIQMCGMVMYYILSGRKHPFGCTDHQCQVNIKECRLEMDHAPLSVEGTDLIKSMLVKEPKARPSIQKVSKHPYFWSIDRQFRFLLTVAKKIEFFTNKLTRVAEDMQDSCLEARDWTSRVDATVLKFVSDFMNKTYFDHFAGILLFALGLQITFDMMPQDLKRLVHYPAVYFLQTFPTVFMSIYSVLRDCSCVQRQMDLQACF